MRATVAWLVGSCLLAQAAAFHQHAAVWQSWLPTLPEVVERSYGRWTCAEPAYVDRVVRLEVPGQPLIVCALDAATAEQWALADSFVLAATDGGRLRCRFCRSRWVPPPLRSQLPPPPQPEGQCRLRPRAAPAADPAAGLLPHRRLDGVACHRAYTMGCQDGFRWCHGSCCRHDSFFYYPDLQPQERVTSPHRSQTNNLVNFGVRGVVASGPIDWTKILDGTFVIIE